MDHKGTVKHETFGGRNFFMFLIIHLRKKISWSFGSSWTREGLACGRDSPKAAGCRGGAPLVTVSSDLHESLLNFYKTFLTRVDDDPTRDIGWVSTRPLTSMNLLKTFIKLSYPFDFDG